MSIKHIHLKGNNIKKLYDSCNHNYDSINNAIRVTIMTVTNMETKETSDDIYTATTYLTKAELKRAKEISDNKVDKLLTISNISDNFNDLLYEYTKEYFK